MKPLTILFFFILFNSSVGHAQVFYIVSVKGTATIKTSGKILKVGDKIDANDQLKFSPDAILVIYNTEKGRYVMKPSPAKAGESEFIAFVKNVMLPVKTNGNLSTRDTHGEAISNLREYFGTDRFLFIGDKYSVKIHPGTYPVNNEKFFIYKYEFNGSIVAKKINFSNGELIFDPIALHTFNGGNIPVEKIEKVDLLYGNGKTNEKITTFMPHYIFDLKLREELSFQLQLLQNTKSVSEIRVELFRFTNEVHGKTDLGFFNIWLDQNLPSLAETK